MIGILYFILACINCHYVAGHGYMIEPPNRSSLWRLAEFKSIVEPNYNDNGLFCGGRGNLASNGGKCGVCGDPYQGPYPNEAGGIYAKGIIARTYRSGQDIPVKIQITANHLGWHEFRLCVNNNISKKITHDCLDKHLLITSDTGLTRTKFSANSGIKELTLQLPKDLVCSQCVLQWKWRTANSPGRSEEEYYGCSDIAIEKSVLPNYSSLSTLLKTSSRQPTRTQPVDIVHHITSTAIPSGRKCKAISPGWRGNPYFDNWCNIQCGNTDCIDHSTFCACDQPTRTQPVDIVQHITSTAIPSGRKCKAISPGWRGNPYFDNWCNIQCGNTDCIDHSTFCACDQPTRTQPVDIVQHITSTAIPSGRKCKAISPGWRGNPYFDNWCNTQCGNTDCIDLSTFCACD